VVLFKSFAEVYSSFVFPNVLIKELVKYIMKKVMFTDDAFELLHREQMGVTTNKLFGVVPPPLLGRL